VITGVVVWTQFERIACEAQMSGEGSNRPGSSCGYELASSATEFRYAIAEGRQTLLYLSGGTATAPESVRLLLNGGVVTEGPTKVLSANTIDVCRNQPPRDPRWWSATIGNDAASAIRQNDTSVYRLEAFVDGQWQLLRLHDSGCKWRNG
jgi:hypothetical protein